MAWWNNINFMGNKNESWGAPRYSGNFGASTMQPQPVQTQQMDRFSQLEFPEFKNEALGTYKDYLNQAPTRDQYKNNIWEKIGAALAGTSAAWTSKNPALGLQTSRQFLDDRYNRAVEEWNTRGKGMAQAAAIEENENQNAYRNWQARNDAILKARDNARQEKATESTIKVNDSRIELNEANKDEINRRAREGKPFEFVDAKGNRVIGAVTVDKDGQTSTRIDLMAPDMQGRKQNFEEKDKNRNFGLDLAQFGETKNQNAIGNMFEKERLGLESRRTAATEKNANAYLNNSQKDTTKESFVSPSAQAEAQNLALQNVYRSQPQLRQFFAVDPRTGAVRLTNPNVALDSEVKLNINGKVVTGTLKDLLELEEGNILGRTR